MAATFGLMVTQASAVFTAGYPSILTAPPGAARQTTRASRIASPTTQPRTASPRAKAYWSAEMSAPSPVSKRDKTATCIWTKPHN